MTDTPATFRASIDLSVEPAAAFRIIVEELTMLRDRAGIQFTPGPEGRIFQESFEVGRVITWEPPRRIVLTWRQASWEPGEVTQVEVRVEPLEGGARAILEHRGWGRFVGDGSEVAAWFVTELAAPLLRAATPAALGDWITDRRARRPSGAQSRAVYRDPLYHYPNFRVILAELALTSEDHFLEVGCGGGALLKEALRSGCRAAAVDHSPDMVAQAREVNREAVTAGRLEVLEADARRLPFSDSTFTCAAMTGVLGFLTEPVAVLGEIRRVLGDGGLLVVLGSDPELRGTPAAPEPMASRLRFYEDDELGNLAREAGFGHVRVVRRDLGIFARESGIPEEHLPLFQGPGSRFLLARKE